MTGVEDANATPAQGATRVSISDEALRLATDNNREQFRLTGPVIQGNLKSAYQMPDALVQEMATREKEEKLREDINSRYAYEHQYKPVGQVLVDGKLVAEVDEGGGYGLAHHIGGLSQNDMDPKARVQEIARALQGKGKVEVKYSDFGPGFGGWSGPSAPESMLPKFTARSRADIMEEVMDTMDRLQAKSAPAPAATAS
ncbi:hypothetical protein RS694_13385 [Rhodoferax saidenbachensis]|uniref:Uncharacterized protein n=1 Tax=Rhodoferax saidenbachensis TaxID=1484693 RepID=A0A1P8KBV0_9BURK|nr:hypothetical protein RS694_13385 [Rhodoferax saidenbachensis]